MPKDELTEKLPHATRYTRPSAPIILKLKYRNNRSVRLLTVPT